MKIFKYISSFETIYIFVLFSFGKMKWNEHLFQFHINLSKSFKVIDLESYKFSINKSKETCTSSIWYESNKCLTQILINGNVVYKVLNWFFVYFFPYSILVLQFSRSHVFIKLDIFNIFNIFDWYFTAFFSSTNFASEKSLDPAKDVTLPKNMEPKKK